MKGYMKEGMREEGRNGLHRHAIWADIEFATAQPPPLSALLMALYLCVVPVHVVPKPAARLRLDLLLLRERGQRVEGPRSRGRVRLAWSPRL